MSNTKLLIIDSIALIIRRSFSENDSKTLKGRSTFLALISSKLKDGRNLNPKSRLKRRQPKRPKRDLIPIKDDQIIPEIK